MSTRFSLYRLISHVLVWWSNRIILSPYNRWIADMKEKVLLRFVWNIVTPFLTGNASFRFGDCPSVAPSISNPALWKIHWKEVHTVVKHFTARYTKLLHCSVTSRAGTCAANNTIFLLSKQIVFYINGRVVANEAISCFDTFIGTMLGAGDTWGTKQGKALPA